MSFAIKVCRCSNIWNYKTDHVCKLNAFRWCCDTFLAQHHPIQRVFEAVLLAEIRLTSYHPLYAWGGHGGTYVYLSMPWTWGTWGPWGDVRSPFHAMDWGTYVPLSMPWTGGRTSPFPCHG